MIIEIFKYLSNPATRSAKKLGQLKETIAMEARYKRSKNQWSSHLKNSRDIIKKATENLKSDQEIIVLGSGLLLDIPIEFLANNFKHIYLIDVVHLIKTKKIGNIHKNISFIEHDITGLADTMLNYPDRELNISPEINIPYLTPNTGLIISANMLSQIHLAPVCYAEEKLGLNDQKLKELAKNIIQNHISLLANLPCRVCLLTDNNRVYKDKNHNIIDGESAIFDIELPKPDKTWLWEIAPMGEIHNKFSMASEVYAYSDFPKKQRIP